MQFILTNSTLTFSRDGKPISLHKDATDERTWERALDALRARDYDALQRIANPSAALINLKHGRITIRDGNLYVDDTLVDTYPTRKALEFIRQGLPVEPILNFIERLQANPSRRAVQDLYQFLEYGKIPLTERGTFVAYKKVTKIDGDLYDIYTRTIRNNPGDTPTMHRNQVDEDPDQTCSFGLHVCSHEYLRFYGAHPGHATIAVEIDPADVVAIPRDYNNTKMRVCKYKVLSIIEEYEEDPLSRTPLHIDDEDEDEDDDWIDWFGGTHPPTDLDTVVEVLLRSGYTHISAADDFSWAHTAAHYDIVAYRVVE